MANSKELTDRLIKSMGENPDSWVPFQEKINNTQYLRFRLAPGKGFIDVKLTGYWVDINGQSIKLGWGDRRRLRSAATILVREITLRAIDRAEEHLSQRSNNA